MMDEYVSRSAVLTKGLDVKSIPDDLIGAGIMVWLDGAKKSDSEVARRRCCTCGSWAVGTY